MKIIPAIDIRNGNCVRLFQGNYGQEKIYSQDPLSIAQSFECAGIEIIHIVDLDAAKGSKKTKNQKIILSIIRNTGLLVEVSGGIRTEEKIKYWLKNGAYRVVLGTKAAQNLEFSKKIFSRYKEKIVVGVDARDGIVMINGWLEKTGWQVLDFIKNLEKIGAKRIIFTDIETDGAMQGPNYAMLKKIIKNTKIKIIASGGISNEKQIRKVATLGAEGAIIGKAIYERKINLKRLTK
jgi:phosphoribosylformimino-5-aminoimidazole carboxamide ribotide isomerase